MESYPGPLKNAMNFGAIAGLALVLVFVLFTTLGMQSSGAQQTLSFAVMIFFMAYGTIQYRKNWHGNALSYGKALGSSTLIAFFCSVLLGFFMYIYILFLDTEFMANMFIQMEQNMADQGTDEAQIEQAMELSKKFFTPFTVAVMAVLTNTFFAFLLALILAAFLKKDQANFDQFIKDQS